MGDQRQAKLRVAVVVGSLDRGGMEQLAVRLASRLDRGLFKPLLVFLPGDGPLRAELDAADVPVAYLGQHGVRPGVWWRLRRILAEARIDLVNAHDWGATFYAAPAARLAGTPCVHTEHGQMKVEPKQVRLRGLFLRRLCCHVVCVSADLAAHLERIHHVPAGHITVIPNGVDVARYRDGAASREDARQRLGLDPDELLIGYVGRLSPEKGVLHLPAAAAAVLARAPRAQFLLVGGGPLHAELARAAAAAGIAGRFHVAGERHDVAACLGAMDLFVLPSLSEGQALSLMEAMSAGKPVVATRVGGNGELVEDGVGGILVPPGDPAALARAIGELAGDRDRCARMAAANRQRAAERFDLSRMVAQYQELYHMLVRRGRGRSR